MIKLVNLEFCVSNPEKGKTLRLSLSELFGIDQDAAVKLRMGYSDGSTSVFEIPTIKKGGSGEKEKLGKED